MQFLSTGRCRKRVSTRRCSCSEQPKLSIGDSVLREALQWPQWDAETLGICHAEVGDTGETIGLLLRGIAADEPLSLEEANELYQQLFQARAHSAQTGLLVADIPQIPARTIKYFVKVITRGLRIGLMEQDGGRSCGAACGVPHQAVREANNRLGDLARVALAARHGELAASKRGSFIPWISCWPSRWTGWRISPNPADWLIEDKYDGIRSQVHFDSGRAHLFARHGRYHRAFLNSREASRVCRGNGLIDGEILAWRDGRALNFNVLQQRHRAQSTFAPLC